MRIWLKVTFSWGFFILYASTRRWWHVNVCIQFIHLKVNAQGFFHDGMGMTHMLIEFGQVQEVLEGELITASSQYIVHYVAKIHVYTYIIFSKRYT